MFDINARKGVPKMINQINCLLFLFTHISVNCQHISL